MRTHCPVAIYRFLGTLAFLGMALGSWAQQPLFSLLSAQETGISFNNAVSESEALNILSYEYFYNGGG